MNKLDIFNASITNVGETYVTGQAVSYFYAIEKYILSIANGLYKVKTGQNLDFVPGTFEDAKAMGRLIDEYGKCLEQCNKNNPNSAKRVIDVKDLLFKFKHIKTLMLSGYEDLRRDGVIIFTAFARAYPLEEQEEFANMLNSHELEYVMQIASQERTIIDKTVSNSRMFMVAKKRMLENRKALDGRPEHKRILKTGEILTREEMDDMVK